MYGLSEALQRCCKNILVVPIMLWVYETTESVLLLTHAATEKAQQLLSDVARAITLTLDVSLALVQYLRGHSSVT